MKIGILQCDDYKDLLHKASSQPTSNTPIPSFPSITPKLLPHPSIKIEEYFVCHGDFPSLDTPFDAFIIPGSRKSVLEASTIVWMQELISFIQKAHRQRRTLIGICFGHQIIAHALGGKVSRMDTPYYGLDTVTWHIPPSKQQTLAYFHEDFVETLPPKAQLLASSPHHTNACYTLGKHILCMQFHPDFSPNDVQFILHNAPTFSSMSQQEIQAFSQDTDYLEVIDKIVAFIQREKKPKMVA